MLQAPAISLLWSKITCLPNPLSFPYPMRLGPNVLKIQEPGATDTLQYAWKRVTEFMAAEGLHVDKYLALSVMEWAVGGLLHNMPRLLPVVQTAVGFLMISKGSRWWMPMVPPSEGVL